MMSVSQSQTLCKSISAKNAYIRYVMILNNSVYFFEDKICFLLTYKFITYFKRTGCESKFRYSPTTAISINSTRYTGKHEPKQIFPSNLHLLGTLKEETCDIKIMKLLLLTEEVGILHLG